MGREVYYKAKSLSSNCEVDILPRPGHVWLDKERKIDVPQVLKAKACTSEGENSECIDSLMLVGGISPITLVMLEKAYTLYKDDIDTICLRSFGGELDVANDMFDFIKTNGLSTCMASYYKFGPDTDKRVPEQVKTKNSYCSSACPFLMFAGQERLALGSNFKLEVHHPGKKFCIDDKFSKVDFPSLKYGNGFLDILERTEGIPEDKKDKFYNLVMSKPYTEKKLLEVPFQTALELEVFNKVIEDRNEESVVRILPESGKILH